MALRLVCFDMDGTLIRNTNSVRYLCTLQGKEKQLIEIENKEDRGDFSWIEADYYKVELIKGLAVERVQDQFDAYIHIISNLDQVLKHLKDHGIKTILVTAGPIQVAQALGEKYGFDQVYGSDYEVVDGYFTEKILKHFGEGGKVHSLLSFCKENSIDPVDCVAIGDSSSDIDVFAVCGHSIAINYSKVLVGKASQYIFTEDLLHILPLLNQNHSVFFL